MTVTSTNQKVQFNGTGSTTVFAYNFKIFAQTDLSVILRSAAGTETVQQTPSNYTGSGWTYSQFCTSAYCSRYNY